MQWYHCECIFVFFFGGVIALKMRVSMGPRILGHRMPLDLIDLINDINCLKWFEESLKLILFIYYFKNH